MAVSFSWPICRPHVIWQISFQFCTRSSQNFMRCSFEPRLVGSGTPRASMTKSLDLAYACCVSFFTPTRNSISPFSFLSVCFLGSTEEGPRYSADFQTYRQETGRRGQGPAVQPIAQEKERRGEWQGMNPSLVMDMSYSSEGRLKD